MGTLLFITLLFGLLPALTLRTNRQLRCHPPPPPQSSVTESELTSAPQSANSAASAAYQKRTSHHYKYNTWKNFLLAAALIVALISKSVNYAAIVRAQRSANQQIIVIPPKPIAGDVLLATHARVVSC